jgi:dipeptidyl aminopeptidase/acylaminoacyl peptidase
MRRRYFIPVARACAASFTLVVTLSATAAVSPAAEDVSFIATCDGSTQHYLLLRPQPFAENVPHHVLIVLHGHGSDRWQGVSDSVHEFRAGRDVAAAHDMLVVSPDYRARTSWMGGLAEADLIQIIDELKSKFRIGKVIVSGASMGGSSALSFAAMHPEMVDGVVSMNGTANHFDYENFQDSINQSFGGAKSDIPAEYKKRSAEYWPERFTMPIGITASGNDTTVPPDSVMRLASVVKKLNPNVLLVYRAMEGHSTSYADSKTVFQFVIAKATQTAAAP